MNELSDVMPCNPDLEVQENPTPKSKGKAKVKETPAAEFVSAKVKLRLLRACEINGEIVDPGAIVEVDEALAQQLLAPFTGMPAHYGYRPGIVSEKICRAEKV